MARSLGVELSGEDLRVRSSVVRSSQGASIGPWFFDSLSRRLIVYRLAGKLKVRDRMFSIPFEMRGDDLLKFRRPEGP
jgi:hypothetical protein